MREVRAHEGLPLRQCGKKLPNISAAGGHPYGGAALRPLEAAPTAVRDLSLLLPLEATPTVVRLLLHWEFRVVYAPSGGERATRRGGRRSAAAGGGTGNAVVEA